MGVSPVTSYNIYGASGTNIYNRVHFRWRCASICTNIANKTWRIKYYLEVKVDSGDEINNLEPDVYSLYSTHRMNNNGTRGSKGFPAGDSWHTAYLESTSSYYSEYIENGCLTFYETAYRNKDLQYHTMNSTSISFQSSSITSRTISCSPPQVPYGGIDYTVPVLDVFEIPQQSIAQTTMDVRYKLTAPYNMTVKITVRDSRYQVAQTQVDKDNDMSLATYSVSGLSPNTSHTVYIEAVCENGETVSRSISSVRTLPIYITNIACPDIYVNEGESIPVVPVISPNDASIKSLRFENTQSGNGYAIGRYNSASVTATDTTITGKSDAASRLPYALKISATDGSGKIKQINVYVCRPADSIAPIQSLRRISVNQTYQIEYRIHPEGSTDTSVTFASDNTSVATVTSSGVVTGISAGEATITLTLAKRGIDENGQEVSAEPLTAELYIRVSDAKEWIDLTDQTFLTADFIDDVFNDLAFLREKFNTYVYNGQAISVPELTAPQTQGRLTPLYDVADILNSVEADIDILYNATKDISEDLISGIGGSANSVYDSPVTWEGLISDANYYVGRWIGYLYYLHDFLLLEGIIE